MSVTAPEATASKDDCKAISVTSAASAAVAATVSKDGDGQPTPKKKHKSQLFFNPRKVTVLDGSMGRLLLNSGVPQCPDLWSGRALTDKEHHPKVIAAHKKYISAGAQCITTANYPVQPTYYRRVFGDDYKRYMLRDTEISAQLALQARAESGKADSVRVLGSLPPLVESHRPDLAAALRKREGTDFVIQTYRDLAGALVRGGVHAIIIETMNDWEEARCAIEGARQMGVPLILSMQGCLLTSGKPAKPRPETAVTVAENLLAIKQKTGAPIVGLGFNCAPPEHILNSLAALGSVGIEKLSRAGIAVLAYANVSNSLAPTGGFAFDSRTSQAELSKRGGLKLRPEMERDGYTEFCFRFIKAGAIAVGGCCSSTPDHIQRFAVALHSIKK